MILKLNKKKLFCDIDNTIADQFSFFKNDYNYHKDINQIDVENLECISGAKKSLKILNEKFNIYFLSARKKKDFLKTKKWLEYKGFDYCELILVDTHKDKIDVLVERKADLFIDDLKYDYEKLQPKLMTKHIDILKKKKINFIVFNGNWAEVIKLIL